MKLKEFDILLDIKRNKKVEEFEIVQGDYETNILKISLVEDFNEYELSGLNVEIAFAKSDGTTVLQDLNNGIELIGNRIVCTLKTNTIASPGKVLAEVRLLQEEKLLTSARFNFFVRQSIVNDKTVESTNEFPILDEMIQDVRDLLDEIQSKPEIQGYSAYQIWLNQGNIGTVDDYLSSLIGPPGETGPPGPEGPQGERGATGSIENLDKGNIEDALEYTPADASLIGLLESLTTEQKTNLVAAINEIDNNAKTHEADYVSLFTTNADAKNSIYRGKYLGNTVTAEQYVAISSGTFTDLYIGDYWTIGGINWRIAAFNYYRNTGDTNVPGNHITIVPDTQLYTHVMNDTNITTGGYTGSKMYTAGLEQAKSTIRGIFGTHLVKHRQIHSNATVDGKASGWAWVDSEVDLMSEIMVYGSVVWGESTIGGSGYNIGVGKSQLPLFALNPRMINTRQTYWLRDVVSASYFAYVNGIGYAANFSASRALGVRPAFSIS